MEPSRRPAITAFRLTPGGGLSRSWSMNEGSSGRGTGTGAATWGVGVTAGAGGAAQAATVSKAKQNDLRASWGAAIRAKIERRKRYPSAAGRASGRAVVRLSVNAAGALTGVSLAQSSGNAALDAAAVESVQRAGKFPSAPKGLGGGNFSFSLPISFSR